MAGGTYLGGPAGAAIGGALGHAAGSILGEVTGLGSYKVSQNSLLTPGLKIVNRNKHPNAVVVRDREYLTDVVSSSTAKAFSLQSFYLNPGLASSFPKLAQIAANYEEYVFEGVIFEFRSTSGDALNSVDTTLGTVVMATSYNPDSPLFASKAEMESVMFVNSAKPSCSALHPIECSPDQSVFSEMYTRSYDVSSKRTYDLGVFQIATAGLQGTSVTVGELWVSYQVALLKPRLYTSLGNANEFSSYIMSTITNAKPLGSVSPYLVADTQQLTPAFPTDGNTFYFPRSSLQQTYLVTFIVQGTAAVLTAPGIAFNNASYAKQKGGGNAYFQSPANGETSSRFQIVAYVAVPPNMPSATVNAASMTFNGAGTLPTAVVFNELAILQVPNSLDSSL